MIVTAMNLLLKRWIPLVLLPLLLGACQSRTVQRMTKAKTAPLTPFLDKRTEMRPVRQRLPVHYVWRNLDLETQMKVMGKTGLYIAPVSLNYLQPVTKDLAQMELEAGMTERAEMEMARELRSRFARAFIQSPKPRYKIMKQPGPETLTLEMAITQLSPTSISGNVVKTVSKLFIGPLAGVFGIFAKGNIAIEGKVSLSDSKTSVLQFADNEKDKATFYNTRDFQPYGHALMAMDEWAAQFEEFTRTYSNHKVEESSFFTLKPW
jgi:Protein of unknown function (DUF3313)